MADTRIVYGAHCSWWDSPDQAARRLSGIACCPTCNGSLYESDETEWWDGVDRKTRIDDPDYRKFIEWLRGRCFTGPDFFEGARALFEIEREAEQIGELVERLEEPAPGAPTQAQLLAVYAAVWDTKWDQRDWHTRAVIDQLRKAGSNV